MGNAPRQVRIACDSETDFRFLLDLLSSPRPPNLAPRYFDLRPLIDTTIYDLMHDWSHLGYFTQLRLDPLGEVEARELLRDLLGDAAGLAQLEHLILAQTEGNPFFIEEVMQTLIEEQVLRGERGHYQLEQIPTTLHIPTTVQGGDRQELALQITLGPAWMATKGLAAPEVETAYTRALMLSRQLGETIELFPALLGLRTFYQVRGELPTARELAEQLLTLARKAQDPALLVQAHRALGATLFSLGELEPARAQLEQALVLYDPRQHHSPAFFHALVFGVTADRIGALRMCRQALRKISCCAPSMTMSRSCAPMLP